MPSLTESLPDGTGDSSQLLLDELKENFDKGTGVAYGQDPLQYLKIQYEGRKLAMMKPAPGHIIHRAPFEVLGCTPECRTCSKHYRPTVEQIIDSRVYDGHIDAATAQHIAFTHIQSVTQDRAYLKEMIERHGNAILNRWSKKNEMQRRELVRAAVPDLYEKKMPQAHITWGPRRAFRKTYLLPYLTVENLCDNKLKLPSLLHYRTSCAPEDWVMFDSDQFRDAYARGLLGLQYNPGCVVLHGPLYGLLLPYDRDNVHAFTIIGWPRA
ncbi:hypothetical protein LTR56_021720 [Elasticomyces elasticus]|nr:hypothetical protein LTR56_021720 [Elasticomyces elasticus]KAK5749212.1 hypothetical protein LTS12_020723 [Elasticomyces elasticus]